MVLYSNYIVLEHGIFEGFLELENGKIKGLYEKWQGKLLAKQIAKLLHTSRHAKVVDLLEKKLAREAQNYPKRRFTGEEGTQIRKIQEQAMKRKKILEAEGNAHHCCARSHSFMHGIRWNIRPI